MGKQGGSTLVEVVISLLLTSVMVSAVFTVILSAKQGGAKADRKLLGGEAVASLQDALKAYQTDNTSNFTNTYNTIKGPNWFARCPGAGNLCPQGWNIDNPGVQEDHQCSLTGAFGTTRPTVSGIQDVYALSTAASAPPSPGGLHCLVCTASSAGGADTACFLPKVLRDPPYKGVIYYQVSSASPPQVQVAVYWDEP